MGILKYRLNDVDSFKFVVKECIRKINSHFFDLGGYLSEAHDKKYFITLGYSDISSCAEAEFGIKKTLAYDLIKIFNTFKDENYFRIKKEFVHLSQSQLIALSRAHAGRENLAAIISSSDTVKDVVLAVKKYNSMSIGSKSALPSSLTEFLSQDSAQAESEPIILTKLRQTVNSFSSSTSYSPLMLDQLKDSLYYLLNCKDYLRAFSKVLPNTDINSFSLDILQDLESLISRCKFLVGLSDG